MVKNLWKKIQDRKKTVIIAEAGVNHNGNIRLAKKLVDAALAAQADAVKFQTFRAEDLVTPDAPKAEYQKAATAKKESQFQMLKNLELSPKDHEELFDYCAKEGIAFLSTPFDRESADFLDALGVELFKIPSGEITNLPLLSYIASMRKPMIVSTGMSTLKEVKEAVSAIKKEGNPSMALLHCVSAYPADPVDANLRIIGTLRKTFRIPVGFSDHTLSFEVALAAVSLGATIIEKHLTLDKKMFGPDHRASLNPTEFSAMVRSIRTIEQTFGSGIKRPASSEKNTAQVARKSLVAAYDIEKGAILVHDMITIKRPGTGLSPALLPRIIGKTARVNIEKDQLITKDMLK